jgi:agmatine/peptidylarginine deiminase
MTKAKFMFRADPIIKRAVAEKRMIFSVVPHDTSWVRDYGPQMKRSKAPLGFTVVDAKYTDPRVQIFVNRERRQINSIRYTLTNDANNIDRTKTQELKDRLYLLQQRDEILALNTLFDRKNDDVSPFEIVQTVTGSDEVKIDRPDLYLEGGNLIRLSDGRLLTTKDLFLRNRGKENELTAEIKQAYGVRDIVYLDSLPGPVIKHVDMFLLPATGKRILLASYSGIPLPVPDPRQVGDLTFYGPEENLTALTEAAAKAMERNKRTLQRLGYEVIDVPALPPARCKEGVYYPTILNALTLRGADDKLSILTPYYPQRDVYQQLAAHKTIRQAFGDKIAKVIPIECTRSAMDQGAVHCLTATIPRRISIFETPSQDDSHSEKRTSN